MLNRRALLSGQGQDIYASNGGLGSPLETSASRSAPEINLIPFIDVLLVVLIFLMISTTFTKYQELAITLPSAEGSDATATPSEILVAVNQEGRYAINGNLVEPRQLVQKLTELSGSWKTNDAVKIGRVIVSADARAPHQHVMRVLEAARESGISNVSFATQSKAQRSLKSNSNESPVSPVSPASPKGRP